MLNLLTDVTTIDIREDHYAAGRNEDGEVVHGSVFALVAQTPDGFRFELDRRFSTNTRQEWESDEDGSYPYWTSDQDAGPRAEALAERIQRHLLDGGGLDAAHWSPIQGCYGSAGWSELGELAVEAREAHAAGEALPSHLLALV